MSSWSFHVVARDISWALSARLAFDLESGLASWWTMLARADRPLLLVRDDSLALPKRQRFEVRGDGLWADLTRHDEGRWQVNFEGIALAVDDPADELGYRTPLEFEFEWEGAGPCLVHGAAQIGADDGLEARAEPGQRYVALRTLEGAQRR